MEIVSCSSSNRDILTMHGYVDFSDIYQPTYYLLIHFHEFGLKFYRVANFVSKDGLSPLVVVCHI